MAEYFTAHQEQGSMIEGGKMFTFSLTDGWGTAVNPLDDAQGDRR